MVAISVITIASIQRNPRPCSARTIKTSAPVINTPASSGRPKRSFSATAEPNTSAKSQAAMAISHKIHKAKPTGRE